MRRVLIVIATIFTLASCQTKYDFIDTGISNGRFDCSMYEYLKNDHENWDSIAKIIDRSGSDIVAMFEKEEITFLGPTNITIKRWFFWDTQNGGYADSVAYTPHGYKSIQDIPVDTCRKIVLSHMVEGVINRDDIPRVTYDEQGNKNGGGIILTSKYGNKVWMWTVQEPYLGIPDLGPITVNMASLKKNGSVNKQIGVATPGLKPNNGVVHSLPYDYSIGELFEAKIKR